VISLGAYQADAWPNGPQGCGVLRSSCYNGVLDSDHLTMGAATPHSAEASALGFYFQSFVGLSTLVGQADDSAIVAVERADDVELKVNSETLLYQLKHSMGENPPAVTLASRALWRTLKVWIDLLPSLALAETSFHLVTVGELGADSELTALRTPGSKREALVAALVKEAERVAQEREAAKAEGKKIPHADRADGCDAFLKLSASVRLNLLRRIHVVTGAATIDQMEAEIASKLHQIRERDRPQIARSLIEWWDRQVVYALCGRRQRFIGRDELLQEIAERISDIEHEVLMPDFELMVPPADYQPEGLLTRQIALVGGGNSDIAWAIREEWRARQQRAKWIVDRPAMASKIERHDAIMREEWSDRHGRIVDDCVSVGEDEKRASGLGLLRWTHGDAPKAIEPISPGWQAPFYVRGSFQVLAINREVGWHPDYVERLKDDEA